MADQMILAKHTLVTALFDIGREKWPRFNRALGSYLCAFVNVLQMRSPMIIFCEAKFEVLVRTVRADIDSSSTVIITSLSDLYMHRYSSLLYDIQKDPAYAKDHPNKECPEIAQPLYNLVVCSKLDLLYRASQIASTDYCIWLDAGYTHGKIDLGSLDWQPTCFYDQKDKISLVCLRPLTDMVEDPSEFSNQYIDIIAGGCIGGSRQAIAAAHPLFYSLMDDILTNHRIKEDDQYYWTFFAKKHPNLVNLIPGSWFTAILL